MYKVLKNYFETVFMLGNLVGEPPEVNHSIEEDIDRMLSEANIHTEGHVGLKT
jgi:hypothetical protein